MLHKVAACGANEQLGSHAIRPRRPQARCITTRPPAPAPIRGMRSPVHAPWRTPEHPPSAACPPQIDNKRGNYHLLEGKLASVLLKAANIDRNSPEGQAVREWRKPGSRSAGNFADVVKHVSLWGHRRAATPAGVCVQRWTSRVARLRKSSHPAMLTLDKFCFMLVLSNPAVLAACLALVAPCVCPPLLFLPRTHFTQVTFLCARLFRERSTFWTASATSVATSRQRRAR